MAALVVPKNQQYTVGEMGPFFSFNSTNGRTIYRDVYVDLVKNVVPYLRELAKAVEAEDYERAAKLRDQIRQGEG